MSGYSCSDCKEGDLVVATRQIEVADGETVSVLDSGVVVATKIGCSNEDCSSHVTAGDEEEEKPKRKKKAPAAENGERCLRADDCSRPRAHTGMCNHKLAAADSE